MSKSLHTKYRPTSFADVVGQDAIVAAIEKKITRRSTNTFLFSGPSGVGKTTIARICAKMLEADVVDVDAATHTGVDNVRELTEAIQYVPFGNKTRVYIIDEAHMLSRGAWNALLKATEEPPEHVFWFICTTEPGKIPPTIKTRCAAYSMKLVSDEDLEELCLDVCEKEHIKLREDIVQLIVAEALGSPRQMLVNLDMCRDAKDKRSAATLLQSAHASDAVIELVRFITKGRGSWSRAMSLVNKLEGESPESVRIVTCNYIGKALQNSTKDSVTCFYLAMLDNFSVPYNASEGIAPLLQSIGRTLYGQAPE